MRDTGERGGQVRKSEGLSHLQALSPELAETCSHHSPRGETILPTCQAFLRYSHGHQPWSIWEENGRGREASVLHPRSHLRGRALFPQSQLERDAGMPPASCQHLPQGPRRPSTLTGDVEPDGCLQGHLRSLECHPTGEVGAVVQLPPPPRRTGEGVPHQMLVTGCRSALWGDQPPEVPETGCRVSLVGLRKREGNAWAP